MPKATVSRQLETVAHPLTGAPADYEPLLALVGNARLPEQFDAMLHFNETRAVELLERTATWEKSEAPETFPAGL